MKCVFNLNRISDIVLYLLTPNQIEKEIKNSEKNLSIQTLRLIILSFLFNITENQYGLEQIALNFDLKK